MGNRVAQGDRAFVSEIAALRREVQQLRRLGSGGKAVNIGSLAPVPHCRVYRSVVQAIPHATRTAIGYNQEYEDNWAMHSIAVDIHRITAPIDGVYMAGVVSGIAANATGLRELYLQKNLDATFLDLRPAQQTAAGSASVPVRMSLMTTIRLVAGDWLSAVWYQTSGVSLDTQNDAQLRDEFWLTWVSH